MRYTPSTTVPTKNKFEVFIDGKLVLTTFCPIAAEIEYKMSWSDDCKIRVTRVQAY